MKLVHLADLHLGFAQFTPARLPEAALAPLVATNAVFGGENERSLDVARSFLWVIDRTIALAPDVVVVAGDIFHQSSPGNSPILVALRAFGRLRRALPDAIIVVIAGNHDVPAAVKPSALPVLAELGVLVVGREPERLAFPALGLSILAVPEAKRVALPAFEPDPAARYNVLLFHGEITGAIPGAGALDRHVAHSVTPAELNAERWDYIALGHYHVTTEVAPNAWYAGSIDYTSSNPWGELTRERELGLAGKGFIERDLATGAHTIHPIPCSRLHLDLGPIGAHGLGADDLNAAIAATLDAAPIDGAVVRLKILDIDRLVFRALDQRMIRQYKLRCLNLALDERRAAAPKAPTMDEVAGEMREAIREIVAGRTPRKPLRELVSERFAAHELPVDIDREEFARVGLEYFARSTTDLDQERDSATEEAA